MRNRLPDGHHVECGNLGRIAPGGKPRALRAEEVEAHRAEPQWFVGRFCKLGFPTSDPQHKEFMWVRTLRFSEGELHGSLENHPVFAECDHGDVVAFTTDEVIDVSEGSN